MRFREDSTVQGDSVTAILKDCGSGGGGQHNSFQWVEPYTTASAKTWDNQYVSTDGVSEARFAESAIHVLQFSSTQPSSATLITRYWMEEAASAQGPTQLVDDQVSPLDLTITYDGANPTYIAPSTGRGWSSATITNNGRASILADGTKIQTALDGSTRASIELVVRVDVASSSGTRLIHIGSSTESGHFTVEASPTKIEFYLFGETIRGEWNPAWDATRMAFHLVYDSTQPTAADRVKLYKNGSRRAWRGGGGAGSIRDA